MKIAKATLARTLALKMAKESLGYRTRRLDRVVSRIYDRPLQQHGLKLSQLSLLAAIELLGPIQPGRLGLYVGLEKSTVSRNVRLMADKGWIQVAESASGRAQLLELTRQGRAKLVAAESAWEMGQKQAVGLFGAESRRLLDSLLACCESG